MSVSDENPPPASAAAPIGIAADHGGFALKEYLLSVLREGGWDVRDFGAHTLEPSDDFPDFVIPLARAVAAGDISRGVACCGSGVGACVAANKIRGVRAALVHDGYSARQGVEHDNMNVLCLGGRAVGEALAQDLVERFLAAQYLGKARHQARLDRIAELEGD